MTTGQYKAAEQHHNGWSRGAEGTEAMRVHPSLPHDEQDDEGYDGCRLDKGRVQGG